MPNRQLGKRIAKRLTTSRVVATCLTAALLLALIILPPSGTAEAAAPSLPYIETLRAKMKTGSTFRILEILFDPDWATGLNYYFPDMETNRLEDFPGFLTATTATERAKQADSWLNGSTTPYVLSAKGDVGDMWGSDMDKFPLNFADYQEGYYWDSAVTYPKLLTLPAEEQKTVIGTRTEQANGPYKTNYSVTLDLTGGNQSLTGGYLKLATAPVAGDITTRYYYKVADFTSSLTLLTASTAYDSAHAGCAVYGKTADGVYEFITYYAPGALTAAHAATYQDGGIYLATTNPAPTSLSYTDGYYELVGATAVPDTSGYLSRKIEGLTLVETGGDCNFTAGTDETFTIYYNKIRYSGGFINHNWFSRFVLDAEDADLPAISYEFDIRSIGDLTAFAADQYSSYDLIIIGGSATATDLHPALISAINGTSGNAPVPTIFNAAELNVINTFGAATHNVAGNGNFVLGSMYFYHSKSYTDQTPPAFNGLFTNHFNDNFIASLSGDGAGFQPVLGDINYENDLRTITGAPQLEKRISIATALRYILNQRQPRVMQPLSQVRILELQPAYVATNTTTTPGAKFLFASEDPIDADEPLNVLNWLRGLEITNASGSKHAVKASDITITRMSTAEFNGKIEDLNESYELIYIGDSRANFSLNGDRTQTIFPGDATMNGLLYFNIGEPIVKTDKVGGTPTYKTAGLLNSDWVDWTNPTVINKVPDTATLRLPGNDISSAKRSELEDYINAGYPVIFAEDLLAQYSGALRDASYEITLTHAPTATPNTYDLTAAVRYFAADGTLKSSIAELTAETVRGTFEWHCITEAGTDTIVSAATNSSPTATLTVDTNNAPGSYYCIYRLISDVAGGTTPLGTSARSNSIAASKDAVHLQIDGLPTSSASGTVAYTGAGGIDISLPTLAATPAAGSAPAYLTATLPTTAHNDLLDAYPGLKYIYTLEQYAPPTSDSFTVGDQNFIGSSTADGANSATVVVASPATTNPTYTFSFTPQIDMLYRVRLDLVTGVPSVGIVTLSPAKRTNGNNTYYDYYAADFSPASIGFAPLSEQSTSTTVQTTRSLIVHNFDGNKKPAFGKTPASTLSAVINEVGGVAPTADVTLTMQSSMLDGVLPPNAEVSYTLWRSKGATAIGTLPDRTDVNQWTHIANFAAGSNILNATIGQGYVYMVEAKLTIGGEPQSHSYTSGFRLSNSAGEIQYNTSTEVLARFFDDAKNPVVTTVANDPLISVTYGYTAPAVTNITVGSPTGSVYPVSFTLTSSDSQSHDYLLQSRSATGAWVDEVALSLGDNTVSMDLARTYRIKSTVSGSASSTQSGYTAEFSISASTRPSNSDAGFALPKSVPTSGTPRTALLTVAVSGTPLGLTADKIPLNAAVNVTTMSGSQNLTANYTYAYQWEKDGAPIVGATAPIHAVTAEADKAGAYRCVVTATETLSGQNGIVSGAAVAIKADTQTAGMLDSGNAPRSGAVNGYRPNTTHVDRWTNLFQFMLDATAKNNTFNQGDIAGAAEGKRPSLRSFLTLSKPSIVFTKNGGGAEQIPTPYTNDSSGMSQNSGGRQLTYGFKISDPADPTPAATTYTVHLYVDANASGKYTLDERMHIDVYAGSQLLTAGAAGYALRSDTEYRVEALLPADIVGIIPWKLEVVKNSTTGDTHYFHGSKIGYTRIKPADDEKRSLTVLQIVGWDQYHQAHLDDRGTTVVLETNPLYKDLLADLEDFDVRLNTIRNDGTCYQYQLLNKTFTGPILRPESMKPGRSDLWQDLNFNEGTKSSTEFEDAIQKIYTELMYYDMLIIGFADCYEGINDTLAHAILRYIESDKAVLFTHDTTSLNNMTRDAYINNGMGNEIGGYWGYSFNQILRPAVGLDYYGIVDPNFRSELAKQDTFYKIGTGTINALKAAGYNIAYKPNSPSGELEEKTQGFATYYVKLPDPDYRPKKITQINAGQITTYPYNVNLAGFPNAPSGAGSTLSVAPTHFQYYTLNMNRDDLVVWYAIADDASATNFSSTQDSNNNYYHTNDAANGYYIYAMGNVTYSGVGHHKDVTDAEAKLFINTMIAAYRSSALNAEVTAKDKNSNDARYMYFPADIFGGQEAVISDAVTPNNEMFAAYFSFVDASIKGGTSGISHARYYYSIGAADVYGDPQRMIPITGAETYAGVGAASVRVPSVSRSQLYHFYIPRSVVNLLAEHNVLRIYMEVTTTYSSGEVGVGHDSIELRKIGLLPLQ